MEFLQRTPFFRLLFPFIIGIAICQYVEFLHWTLYALFSLSVLLTVLSFVIRNPKRQFKFRWLFGCGIFVFMFTLACILCSSHEKADGFDRLHQKGMYRIELVSSPVEKARSYMCRVKVLQLYSTTTKPVHGQAILYLQKDKRASRLMVGDRLLVEAEFSPPAGALNPAGFDYAAYLKRQGVGATCYVRSDRWEPTDRNTAFSIQSTADRCQKSLLDIYRKFHIRGDEFSVLAALTLGYTDDLQPDIRASYSATGVVHILSVSGMHVGVVYVVMAFLLGFMSKNQRQKIIKALFVMSFLWGYAFLSGMSPAVIRATLMFSFVALATCFDRQSRIYNTIFMSMLAMLIVNPNYLFDVGFQLSYAAVLSILFFKPIVDKLYQPTNRFTRSVWTLFSVSLAAQLGTTPFTLYYFQQFPNYFMLTNFIAIPLSTVVIYLAMGLLFVSYIPYVSVCVGFLLNGSVRLLNYVIVTIQNLPYSVSHISLDIRQSAVLFLALFCLSGYYFNKKITPLVVGLASLFLACVFSIVVNYQTLTSKRMIVYAGTKNTHISFINRNQNYVFTTDSFELKHIAMPFWQNQKLDNPVILKKNNWFNNGFSCFDGIRLLILTGEFLKKTTTNAPIDLDYLIIGNHLKPKIEQLTECVHPRNIIVDTSISKWYANAIRQFCRNRKIGFYSVADQGAFILNIKD